MNTVVTMLVIICGTKASHKKICISNVHHKSAVSFFLPQCFDMSASMLRCVLFILSLLLTALCSFMFP